MKRQTGLSLVELMVALLVGVLVILGVTQVFTASFRANTESIQFTQLNEQLRAVSNTMSREIRRAGFWSGSVLEVKAGAQLNPFASSIQTFDQDGDTFDDCIIYGYDVDEDGADTDAGEWRGFRFTDPDADGLGRIDVKTSGSAADADCTAGTWQSFLPQDVVEISNLTFNYSGNNNWVKVTDDCPDTATESRIYVRTILMNLTGQLAADPNVSRNVQTWIRVRNDRIDTGVATVCT